MNMRLSQHYNLDNNTVKEGAIITVKLKYQMRQRTDNYIIFVLNTKYNRLRIKEIFYRRINTIFKQSFEYTKCVYLVKKT
jgi:hypothetical protein